MVHGFLASTLKLIVILRSYVLLAWMAAVVTSCILLYRISFPFMLNESCLFVNPTINLNSVISLKQERS